jgi:hypothetical protein
MVSHRTIVVKKKIYGKKKGEKIRKKYHDIRVTVLCTWLFTISPTSKYTVKLN